MLAPLLAAACAAALLHAAAAVHRISWQDVADVAPVLEAQGISSHRFDAYLERLRDANRRRVREGDLDHLVFYVLQSRRFTSLPAIEPALSAKALVEALDEPRRGAFLKGESAPSPPIVPHPVGARIGAFLRALDSPGGDARLAYFRSLVRAATPPGPARRTAIEAEYVRAMRFLYEKEFAARRPNASPDAAAALYRSRGLSTDTAVEAGFLVYQGLGIVKALDPAARIRRVLIVGPGLSLAPRTALMDDGPPESYQPWSVIDALLGLGLSDAGDLEVIAADINPRVVAHLRRAASSPPMLTLATELGESDTLSLTKEFRDYFGSLGGAVGGTSVQPQAGGRLRKTVAIRAGIARVLRAETLDVTTERFDEPRFDLIVATNVLPYFDDVPLTLAMSNISAMLAPGGTFLHNEARPLMNGLTAAVGLPLRQSRHAVIAAVRGAPAPLGDSVWVHRKAPPQS